MIQPTLQNRIASLDVLRGLAILGILLANLGAFAGPYLLPLGNAAPGSFEDWTNAFTLAFVNGKWRSLLAILFGVGLYLQFVKRSPVPGNWPGGYLRRTAVLAGIGIFHGLFIWWGDILFIYSLTAFVACFMASLPSRTLWIVIACGLGLSFLGSLPFVAMGLLIPNSEMTGSADDYSMFGLSMEQQMNAYALGNYFTQFGSRAIMFLFMAVGGVFYIVFLLPLFLLGMLMARDGVLKAPSQHPVWRKWTLGIGLGVGLPLNLIAIPLIA